MARRPIVLYSAAYPTLMLRLDEQRRYRRDRPTVISGSHDTVAERQPTWTSSASAITALSLSLQHSKIQYGKIQYSKPNKVIARKKDMQ
ncbi:hypothetical protein ACSS6W_004589 [Trichoderma asperelloides]